MATQWLDLQVKIFLRWVNQRLAVKSLKIADLKDFGSGEALVGLMEVLSETTCALKLKPGAKVKMQMIDNCTNALKFVTQCGIKGITCSAENLVDGEAKSVLGLLWAIMQAFLKFSDDDDGPALSVKDSLIMWFQNQTSQFKLEIPDVTKSFHNGLILAATIAKHRPLLIDFASLAPENGPDNLQKAFNAATDFFGFEQFLTPAEMVKLDEKSMIVFLAEFFYGIAAQRKIDLAARRIGKVISFTKENDAMRATYQEKGARLKALLASLEEKMADRTIDNTMAGAKARLEGFYNYKTQEKGQTVDSDFLSLETCANLLAMRLAQHKRPPFTPAEGTTLGDFQATMKKLEESEASMKLHLHAELNRQVKLVDLNNQHDKRNQNIQLWGDQKRTYLNTKQDIKSVGAAQFQLRQLQSFQDEAKSLREGSISILTQRGDELRAEKYEFSAAVTEREAGVTKLMDELAGLAAHRQKIAEDDLAREQFKAEVLTWVSKHQHAHDSTMAWVTEKTAFLSKKEEVNSIGDAEFHLSLINSYRQERQELEAARVPPLKQLGEKILTAEYKSEFSSWALDEAGRAALQQREEAVQQAFPNLDKLSDHKLAVLNDDLAREKFREKLRQDNIDHVDMFSSLLPYIAAKKAYLAVKEPCDSIADATNNLNKIATYAREKEYQTTGPVAALKSLGNSIVTRKYQTELSSYVYPNPQEVTDRESQVDAAWAELDAAYATKKAILEDDLAREEFRERLRLSNENHKSKFSWLNDYAENNAKTYLKKAEPVDSIADALNNLAALASFEHDHAGVTSFNVASLKRLGDEILTAKYETALSSYVFATPDEVKTREGRVDELWAEIAGLSKAKGGVLAADLAREQKKEELRLTFADAASDLTVWLKDREEDSTTTHFGFTLKQVEDFKQVLDQTDATTVGDATGRAAGAKNVHAEAAALGVRENVYTSATPASIDQQIDAFKQALGVRQQRYADELKRQRDNDALCQQFAGQVVPFAQGIDGVKETLTSSAAGDLDAQAKIINDNLAQDDSKVVSLETLQAQMDAAGISVNIHTTLTGTDARLIWNSYQAFLSVKKKNVDEEIQVKKMRGMSAEQFAELERMFKQFDASANGFLDKREFKACLYSLGDERGSKEVQEIMTKYSKNDEQKGIDYSGFLEFMITELGDTDTHEEIILAFALINGDISAAQKKRDQMNPEEKKASEEQIAGLTKVAREDRLLKGGLMSPDEVNYIKGTHPAEGGVQYDQWAASVFSR